MSAPTVFKNHIIHKDIEGNKSSVANLNNTTLGIQRTQAMQTKCIGKYCDRQRSYEMRNQGCVCWDTSSIVMTNLALLNIVVVDYRNS